jgi:hypothetical protein
MILVYSAKITNRLRYSVDLLLGNLLGIPYDVTSDTEVYLNFKGARINYSRKELFPGELPIIPAGLLEMRGVQHLLPPVEKPNGLPVLFPSSGTTLGFDPFSAAFYLVSRYEEYLPFKPDQHGRFEARQSLAFKHGFLEIPVVNHYALLLKNALLQQFSFLEFPEKSFSYHPTYDVDVAYAFKSRSLFRSVAGSIRTLFAGDLQAVKERWQVILNKKTDPFDTYDLQLQLHKKYGLKAYYFFLCADYGPFDKNIAFFSPGFQKLVKMISDYAYTGLHPSYASNEHEHLLGQEVTRLNKILNREIRFSRQHYLRLRFPDTYRNLIRNNITRDFSMGYATLPGFRAGICSPFVFYDLERETTTNLLVFPFTVMDGTLKDYMNLDPAKALETIHRLMQRVFEVNGTFMSLWHNESLCECQRWKGWRSVYEEMVEMGARLQTKSHK